MQKYFVIAIFLAILTACSVSNKYQPDENNISEMQKKVPGLTMAGLKEGLNIYKKSCASCHQLYAPSAFTKEKWEKDLSEMIPRAKITDPLTEQKLRNYLYAMSK